MELLLNLAWLLLALPAFWLWRGRKSARFSSLQCLLALGCLLVILFPVISATDDLCAMKAEMEESPSGKHALRHASTDKAGWSTAVHGHTAMASSARFSCASDESRLLIPRPCLYTPAAPAFDLASRAPPTSLLG